MVVVLIKDTEGVDQLDAILSVKGIDMVLEGAVDLSQSFGVPGQLHHSNVQTAIARSASDCAEHDVEFCAIPRTA